MSAKKGIHKWHRCKRINIIAKYIEHIHTIVKLKVYWLSCYFIHTGRARGNAKCTHILFGVHHKTLRQMLENQMKPVVVGIPEKGYGS